MFNITEPANVIGGTITEGLRWEIDHTPIDLLKICGY